MRNTVNAMPPAVSQVWRPLRHRLRQATAGSRGRPARAPRPPAALQREGGEQAILERQVEVHVDELHLGVVVVLVQFGHAHAGSHHAPAHFSDLERFHSFQRLEVLIVEGLRQRDVVVANHPVFLAPDNRGRVERHRLDGIGGEPVRLPDVDNGQPIVLQHVVVA